MAQRVVLLSPALTDVRIWADLPLRLAEAGARVDVIDWPTPAPTDSSAYLRTQMGDGPVTVLVASGRDCAGALAAAGDRVATYVLVQPTLSLAEVSPDMFVDGESSDCETRQDELSDEFFAAVASGDPQRYAAAIVGSGRIPDLSGAIRAMFAERMPPMGTDPPGNPDTLLTDVSASSAGVYVLAPSRRTSRVAFMAEAVLRAAGSRGHAVELADDRPFPWLSSSDVADVIVRRLAPR